MDSFLDDDEEDEFGNENKGLWSKPKRRQRMIEGLQKDWASGGGVARRWPLSEAAQKQVARSKQLEIQSTFRYMQRHVQANGMALLHRDYGYNLRTIQEKNKNVGGYCVVSATGALSRTYYLTSGEHGVFGGKVDRSTCVEAKALRAAEAVRSISQLIIYTHKYPCMSCQKKIREARAARRFLVTVKYGEGLDYP
jgi:hypothetical protein